MEFSSQFDWLPDPSLPAGSVLDRATRAVNGVTLESMQRRNMGQPLTGVSPQDIERRTYGFYNVGQPAIEIHNSFVPGRQAQT